MGAAFVAFWVALIVLAGVCFVASIFTAENTAAPAIGAT